MVFKLEKQEASHSNVCLVEVFVVVVLVGIC